MPCMSCRTYLATDVTKTYMACHGLLGVCGHGGRVFHSRSYIRFRPCGVCDGSRACRSGLATVGGGGWNAALGGYGSVVSGGLRNTAAGSSSAVLGGTDNLASDDGSTVAGGRANRASGNGSFVGGGHANTASGSNAAVSAGALNAASGGLSFVAGGRHNNASAMYAFVGGGFNNTVAAMGGTTLGSHTLVTHGDAGAFGFRSVSGDVCHSVADGSLNICVDSGVFVNGEALVLNSHIAETGRSVAWLEGNLTALEIQVDALPNASTIFGHLDDVWQNLSSVSSAISALIVNDAALADASQNLTLRIDGLNHSAITSIAGLLANDTRFEDRLTVVMSLVENLTVGTQLNASGQAAAIDELRLLVENNSQALWSNASGQHLQLMDLAAVAVDQSGAIQVIETNLTSLVAYDSNLTDRIDALEQTAITSFVELRSDVSALNDSHITEFDQLRHNVSELERKSNDVAEVLNNHTEQISALLLNDSATTATVASLADAVDDLSTHVDNAVAELSTNATTLKAAIQALDVISSNQSSSIEVLQQEVRICLNEFRAQPGVSPTLTFVSVIPCA